MRSGDCSAGGEEQAQPLLSNRVCVLWAAHERMRMCARSAGADAACLAAVVLRTRPRGVEAAQRCVHLVPGGSVWNESWRVSLLCGAAVCAIRGCADSQVFAVCVVYDARLKLWVAGLS